MGEVVSLPAREAQPVMDLRSYPVMEVFGPTIQGEGFLAGLPTYFIRFGGCDFRCSWCDSMFAVEPSSVREHAEKLTLRQIEERVLALPGEARWLTLSGGNPALMHFREEDVELYLKPWLLTVETQGSVWRPWLGRIDHLTVSPKPPSSGMVTRQNMIRVADFMRKAEQAVSDAKRSIKIVAFDDLDYEWARNFFNAYPRWSHRFMSVGTPPVGTWGSEVLKAPSEAEVRRQVCDGFARLADRVACDPLMSQVKVFPQLHVLAWSHARGV